VFVVVLSSGSSNSVSFLPFCEQKREDSVCNKSGKCGGEQRGNFSNLKHAVHRGFLRGFSSSDYTRLMHTAYTTTIDYSDINNSNSSSNSSSSSSSGSNSSSIAHDTTFID
jgi:hypothetical protein